MIENNLYIEINILYKILTTILIMQNLELDLEFLGFTNEETKVYLTCLEFGELPISTISKITKIWRVNLYYHSQRLVDKWYLSFYQKNWIKIFVAENPQIFINKEKEKLNIANKVFPELLAILSKSSNRPKIQFFEWENWIKTIFERFLIQKNSEIVTFSNFERVNEFFKNNDFLENHFDNRIKSNIKTRFISPKTKVSEDFVKKILLNNISSNLLEVFLIPSSNFFFSSEISIFSNSIAILNLNKENPIWVLIENKELYDTQKAIFDLAWLWATSFIVS